MAQLSSCYVAVFVKNYYKTAYLILTIIHLITSIIIPFYSKTNKGSGNLPKVIKPVTGSRDPIDRHHSSCLLS